MSSETIIKTIKELTAKSGLRGQRLKNIKALNTVIGELHKEILSELGKVPNPKLYKDELSSVNNALTELATELGKNDVDNDDLIKTILANANQLIAIRENMPGYDKGSPPPSVANARKQIDALSGSSSSLSMTPSLTQTPSSSLSQTQSRSYSDAVRGNNQRDDDNPFTNLKGGYKHNTTSSRKYMVKRFRSSRNSFRRGKKRGGKKTIKRRK
jgi:hypothetical protein